MMTRTRAYLFSVLAAAAFPAAASAHTTTFAFTGGEQTFTVPGGVTRLFVTATGAAGAGANYFPGGRGAIVGGTIRVSPHQVLYVDVGGNGGLSSGGFNGGGDSPIRNGLSAYGGGGASDVRTISRTASGSLESRLIVAAGGGGSAYPAAPAGDAGAAGGVSPGADPSAGGAAGTQTAGGAGGCTSLNIGCGGDGTLGLGGPGGSSGEAEFTREGGGGGGGLYGGGGGAGVSDGTVGGGGGGSSLVPSGGSLSLAALTQPPSIVITPLKHRAPRVYISLGDSVAAGFGASQPSKGYAHLLFHDLTSTPRGSRLDIPYYDGVPGESSTSILRPGGQLDTALAQINDPSTNTKFVVIDIGGNDALGDPRCSTGLNGGACPFAANFARILDDLNGALRRDPGRETLEVIAYYNPGVGTPLEARYDLAELGTDLKIDCSGTGAQLGLNDLITCIGREKGAVVADAYPPFKAGGQALMASDRIHPNDAGHAAIAAVAAEAAM